MDFEKFPGLGNHLKFDSTATLDFYNQFHGLPDLGLGMEKSIHLLDRNGIQRHDELQWLDGELQQF